MSTTDFLTLFHDIERFYREGPGNKESLRARIDVALSELAEVADLQVLPEHWPKDAPTHGHVMSYTDPDDLTGGETERLEIMKAALVHIRKDIAD